MPCSHPVRRDRREKGDCNGKSSSHGHATDFDDARPLGGRRDCGLRLGLWTDAGGRIRLRGCERSRVYLQRIAFRCGVRFVSQAPGSGATAIGSGSEAGGNLSTNYGNAGTTAIGSDAEAGSSATGQANATALGANTQANALNATALGAGATANFANSTAIGQGVSTTRDNQVAIGTGANTYTLAGVNSQASKDAQSGTTYMMTTDATGNLAASTFDLASLDGLPDTVAQHATDITESEHDGRSARTRPRFSTSTAVRP